MSTEKKGGRVVRLQAESVKRIRAVDISPSGAVVTIRGNNAQGKSSVLDAIAYALGGKGLAPPKVIREGEQAAKVVLELEDLVVERRWTANDRSTLEVRSKEGAKYPSPQSLLDRLVGDLSFDPLAFLRLPPEKQVHTFARLIGFDLGEWEARRRGVFDERTAVNRELSSLQARLAAAPKPDGDPKPVNPQALLDEMGQLMEKDRQRALAERTVDAAQAAVADGARELARCNDNVARLERELVDAREAVLVWEKGNAQRAARLVDARTTLEAWPATAPEMERVKRELAGVEKTNALARQAAEHTALASDVEKRTASSKVLTDRIAELDEQRSSTMAAAKMPVEGLGFGTSGGLTLNGIPIEQSSTSEQLKVSVAMGLALNPKLRVLLVRDASLLDAESMAVLTKMAADADAQVWAEVVGTEGVGIVIEDGAVKTATPAADAAQGTLL